MLDGWGPSMLRVQKTGSMHWSASEVEGLKGGRHACRSMHGNGIVRVHKGVWASFWGGGGGRVGLRGGGGGREGQTA